MGHPGPILGLTPPSGSLSGPRFPSDCLRRGRCSGAVWAGLEGMTGRDGSLGGPGCRLVRGAAGEALLVCVPTWAAGPAQLCLALPRASLFLVVLLCTCGVGTSCFFLGWCLGRLIGECLSAVRHMGWASARQRPYGGAGDTVWGGRWGCGAPPCPPRPQLAVPGFVCQGSLGLISLCLPSSFLPRPSSRPVLASGRTLP